MIDTSPEALLAWMHYEARNKRCREAYAEDPFVLAKYEGKTEWPGRVVNRCYECAAFIVPNEQNVKTGRVYCNEHEAGHEDEYAREKARKKHRKSMIEMRANQAAEQAAREAAKKKRRRKKRVLHVRFLKDGRIVRRNPK